MFISTLFVVFLPKLVNSVFYESNTTDLTKCDVSYSRSGSTYNEFYQVDIHENDTLKLDFHFAVLAASDAHILLSESDNVNKSVPAYEIVIGAGGNTFCDIRRMQKSDVKQSVLIKGLLSALDPHFFWLHIKQDGTIEVGVEGGNTSFIDWLDPEPLKVKFISFSTWSGIEAKWYFNCDRSQSEEEALKRLSATAKLRRLLLLPYDPLVRPGMNESTDFFDIYMATEVTYLEFNEGTSTIDTRGKVRLRWHDEKLSWDPSLFENVTFIHADRKEIWIPRLKSSYSQNPTGDLLEDDILIVDNSGDVLWESNFRMASACRDSKRADWPRNIYACKLFFLSSVHNGGFFLNISTADSDLNLHDDSEWMVVDASMFDQYTLNASDTPPLSGLYMEIRRASLNYSIVFLLPFVAISTCLLFSFWVSPRGNTKLFLGCLQLIIETLILLALAHFIPHKATGMPLLIVLYSWCLGGSLVALMISAVVVNICKKKKSTPLPHVICNFLTKKSVKTILWLPNIVMPEDYGDLDISLSISNVSRIEDNKDHQVWILLAVAIERIAFVLYLILMAVIIIKYVTACF